MRAASSSGLQYEDSDTLERAAVSQYYSVLEDRERVHQAENETSCERFGREDEERVCRAEQEYKNYHEENSGTIHNVEQDDSTCGIFQQLHRDNNEEVEIVPAPPTEAQQLDLIKVKPVMEQNNLCASTPLSKSLNKFLEGSELTINEVDQLLQRTLAQMEAQKTLENQVKIEQVDIKDEYDQDQDSYQESSSSHSIIRVIAGPYMKFTTEEFSKLNLVNIDFEEFA